MTVSKQAFALVVFCSLFLGVGMAQTNRCPSLQPTPLEAFANLAATRVEWSKEVGRLDSSEGHAVVIALILEDTAQPRDRMRGIRIDLFSLGAKDEVYLGEETLGAYKNALDEITQLTSVSGNMPQDLIPDILKGFGQSRINSLGAS